MGVIIYLLIFIVLFIFLFDKSKKNKSTTARLLTKKPKIKKENYNDNYISEDEINIMHPFFKTSKSIFLIPPHYDTDCNSLSPLNPKLFDVIIVDFIGLFYSQLPNVIFF